MEIPTLIASRYRVLRELGRGGMGVVYLVEHVNTGDYLALKVLLGHSGARADVVERFKREARAPARIKSENVVKITDADVAPELGGAPFLVMEALDGSDLEKRVAAGPLSPAEVLGILVQVAGALDKAHALGIVHRDLKPENLFLHRRENGESIVKILDFGISKMLGEGPSAMEQAGLTKTGAIMGTPLYMSPEQARGDISLIGPPTDVWAIGLIAYKLLTGQIYWWAQSMTELLLQIVNEPLIPPSKRAGNLPLAFDVWFARSCERDPARRWPSVGAQVQALSAALGASVAPLSPPPLTLGHLPTVAAPLLASRAVLALTPAQTPSIGISASPVSTTQVPRTRGSSRVTIAIVAASVAALALVVVLSLLGQGPSSVRTAPASSPQSPVVAAPASSVAETAPPPTIEPPPPAASVPASGAASTRSAGGRAPAPPAPKHAASGAAVAPPTPAQPAPPPKKQTFAPEAP